jgi:hypothetical protein
MELLKQLIEIRGTSGDEGAIKNFILKHVTTSMNNWKVQPQIIHGEEFQDAIILWKTENCHFCAYRHHWIYCWLW